jgi:hypothetical protein
MITNARALQVWARTELLVWPGEYLLVSLPLRHAERAALLSASVSGGFAAWLRERDELSLTLPRASWSADGPLAAEARVSGPLRLLTLDIDIALDVCGYLAPAAERLAAEGIPIVPQCGFLKDHLLVPAERLDDALAVLEGLIRGARVASAGGPP